MRKVYGVSSKFGFGKWEHVAYVFDTKEEAKDWLCTEEHDFRTREILCKTKAIELAGRKVVEKAINHKEAA